MQAGSGIAMGSPSNGGIALVRIIVSHSAIKGVILRELKSRKLRVPFIISQQFRTKTKTLSAIALMSSVRNKHDATADMRPSRRPAAARNALRARFVYLGLQISRRQAWLCRPVKVTERPCRGGLEVKEVKPPRVKSPPRRGARRVPAAEENALAPSGMSRTKICTTRRTPFPAQNAPNAGLPANVRPRLEYRNPAGPLTFTWRSNSKRGLLSARFTHHAMGLFPTKNF